MLAHYTELVRLFPNDERAQTLLGNTYFGRQEYETAIKHYVQATAINPSFSPPYNQLGYAYRFLEKFPDAEKAFKKYTELIPDDPNPLRLVRRTADEDGALRGIDQDVREGAVAGSEFRRLSRGDRQQLPGDGTARSRRARRSPRSRPWRGTRGERRLARFWTAASYVHEGATEKAIAELRASTRSPKRTATARMMSGDLTQMGDVLREAGRIEDALAKYAEAVTVINKAKVPEEVKEATRRNHLFEEGRVAAAGKDIATAKTKVAEYTRQVAVKKRPFEVRQQHELAGLIALAEKRSAAAAQEFQLANQQDPRILYLTAVA